MCFYFYKSDEKDFITIHVLFEDSENHKNEPIAAAIFQFYWLLLFYETIEFLKVRPEYFFLLALLQRYANTFQVSSHTSTAKKWPFFGAFVVQWMISFAY